MPSFQFVGHTKEFGQSFASTMNVAGYCAGWEIKDVGDLFIGHRGHYFKQQAGTRFFGQLMKSFCY
ncbi:MAG: hypothetical protein AAGG44_21450, partial [Planctomycetota bacterium]